MNSKSQALKAFLKHVFLAQCICFHVSKSSSICPGSEAFCQCLSVPEGCGTKEKNNAFFFNPESLIQGKFKHLKRLNVLHACVYIYMQHLLSSFRAPTLWFINLTVTTCFIQYAFWSLCHFFSQENRQNTKILEVRHFHMIQIWPPTVTRCAKH